MKLKRTAAALTAAVETMFLAAAYRRLPERAASGSAGSQLTDHHRNLALL